MKQKLFIFLALIFLFILLIGLNAVSYVQKEQVADMEDTANRSTYSVGAAGTRAFYDLLAETGEKVKRWREPFPSNGEFDASKFSTFVIIGKTLREFEQEEIEHILDWVSAGGKLVVIERNPYSQLVTTTTNWEIILKESEKPTHSVDSSNQVKMVGKANAIKPGQPSIFTDQVNAVQPSQFASSISIKRVYVEGEFEEESEEAENENTDLPKDGTLGPGASPPPPATEDSVDSDDIIDSGNKNVDEIFREPSTATLEQLDTPTALNGEDTVEQKYVYPQAPVIHLTDGDTNLLVDFPYGEGQIVFLSDPYIVANGGIKLVDNARLATNIVTSREGIIAFDEYHQGYGSNENRLLKYFSGTPVVAIFLQIFLIVGLVFYSQSKRFARALPNNDANRLSKLEYVSAMAQLQGRTKAFDLAIENIYTDFRRRVSRLFGVDNHTSTRKQLATKIAERLNRDANGIEDIMFKCEDIMHGEPVKKKETVRLVSQIRELEQALGLRRGKKRHS